MSEASAVIEINPNLRFPDNSTVVDSQDVSGGPVKPNDVVVVWERQSGIIGRAWVKSVDEQENEIRLIVDWANLTIKPGVAAVPAPGMERNLLVRLPIAQNAA